MRLSSWLAAALSLLISLVMIRRPSFWFDEAATISATSMPLSSLWQLLHEIDMVHALYYLIMHPWVDSMGTSELVMRLPSAVALGAASFLFTRMAVRLLDVAPGTIAGLIFVFLPGNTWSGVEARSAAFVLLTAVIATSLLVSWLRRERKGLVWYAVVMTIGAYLSILLLALLAAHLLLVLLHRRKDWLGFMIPGTAAVIAAAPVVIIGFTQRSQIAWIDHSASGLLWRVLVSQSFLGPGNDRPLSLAIIFGIILAVSLLASIVMAARASRPDLVADLGLAVFIIPTVLIAGATLAGLQLYQERYLIFVNPAVALLLARGITAVRAGRVQAVLVALLVLLSLPAIWLQKAPDAKYFDDYRHLAEFGSTSQYVIFDEDAARSIAIAYPQQFTGATDLSLEMSPAESGSLWGTSQWADIESWPGMPGTFTVYSYAPRPTIWIEEALAYHCQTGPTMSNARWRASTFHCPGW